MLPAFLIAVEFSISGYGKGFYFITMLYAGLAVVEGLLTAGIVAYFQRVKPEILSTAQPAFPK
ncbi:cobalt transport protein CbiM [compost metagenome]